MPHDATIINQCCIAGMKTLPDDHIDLTVTSPPYDDMRTYDGHADAFDFKATAKQLYRATKPGGVVVWVVGDQTKDGDESGTSFRQALFFKDIGFNLWDTMIWDKGATGCYGSPKAYQNCFEYMFVFAKDIDGSGPKAANMIKDRRNMYEEPRDKIIRLRTRTGELKPKVLKTRHNPFGKRKNVWYFSPGWGKSGKDPIAHKHPAIFPEALARDHIRSWSNEGDLVFDPFTGSGTTAIMAIDNGRRFLGFEINPDYCEVARTRLARHAVQERLF